MILLLLIFFFWDPVELVTLAVVCVAILIADCCMEVSVAVEEGGSCGVTVAVLTIDFTLHCLFIGQWNVSRQLRGFSAVATFSSKILLL